MGRFVNFTIPSLVVRYACLLKGWVERVFSLGFGYGTGEYTDTHFGDRYGEGVLTGKKAMIITTVGGTVEHYSARGINGPINDVLFTINHGLLFFTGMTVLPPFVTYKTDSATEEVFQNEAKKLRETLKNIETIKPINYRKQNFGDYNLPGCTLKEGLEQPGETGYDIHIIKD